MSSSFEKINIPLMNISVNKRPLFPNSCFMLDMSDKVEVEKKYWRQIFFYFPVLNGTRVKIVLEDKQLLTKRPIKSNLFHSSGDMIEIENLGKILFINATWTASLGTFMLANSFLLPL